MHIMAAMNVEETETWTRIIEHGGAVFTVVVDTDKVFVSRVGGGEVQFSHEEVTTGGVTTIDETAMDAVRLVA